MLIGNILRIRYFCLRILWSDCGRGYRLCSEPHLVLEWNPAWCSMRPVIDSYSSGKQLKGSRNRCGRWKKYPCCSLWGNLRPGGVYSMLRVDRRNHHLFWIGKTMVFPSIAHIASKHPFATIHVDRVRTRPRSKPGKNGEDLGVV